MKEFYEEGKTLQKEQFELQKAMFIEQNKLSRAAASTFAQAAADVAKALSEAETDAVASGTLARDGGELVDLGDLSGLSDLDQRLAEKLFTLEQESRQTPQKVITTMNESAAGALDAWQGSVLTELSAIKNNTDKPQQIHLKVQLPGGEFKTFVLDVVQAELSVP